MPESTHRYGRAPREVGTPHTQERLQLSHILESPALNYYLSESRILARLLTAEPYEFGLDMSKVLSQPMVQEVLGRHRIAAQLPNDPERAAGLRYIAHLYNATLGTDFEVFEKDTRLVLYSDGALRRTLEDLQDSGKFEHAWPARSWNSAMVEHFLEKLPQTLPNLERFLLKAAPDESVLAVPPSNLRTQPLYVQEIVIPTANRSQDLRRLLRSLQRNFEFYGYRAQGIAIHVFDTSTTSLERSATARAVQRAGEEGLQVRYLGPSQVRSELKKFREQVPENLRKVFSTIFMRGLYSRSGSDGLPLTIGTIRNAIALIMRDRPYLSLDDDMMLDAPIPKAAEYEARRRTVREKPAGFDLHVGAATDYVRMDALPSTASRKDIIWVPTDILGIANRHLDKPLYLAESRIVGDRTESSFTLGEARISVVRPYLAGASPDVTIYLRKFIATKDANELSGTQASYGLPLEVPASVLHRGYSSGTMFASSSGLSTPFLDARAYEDVAQSQLSEVLFGNNVQYQGGVVEHRRHIGARVVSSDQYIDVLLGHLVMGRYLSSVMPGSFALTEIRHATNRVQAFRTLGQRMWKDAQGVGLGRATIDSLTQGYKLMGAAARSAGVEGADSFLMDDTRIAERIMERSRVMLRLNALLYFYWPDFASAASKLSEL